MRPWERSRRYYWTNYYKEVEGKVRRSVQVYSSLLKNVQAEVYLSIIVLIIMVLFVWSMQIKMCDHCQCNAPQLKTAATELHPVKVLPQVWCLVVGMDLIGPFQPTALGHKYVLTMTDYFSKYVEAVPIPDKSALSVAQGIHKVYCRQGAQSVSYAIKERSF